MDDDEARIGADDGFQGDVVHSAEGVAGAGAVYPLLDVVRRGGSKGIEGIVVDDGIVVEVVDDVEHLLPTQFVHDEQHRPAWLKEVVGDVLALFVDKGKVVDGGDITLVNHRGARGNECPGAIRIVVEGELALLAILAEDERRLETGLRSIVGYSHSCLDVRTYAVGAEVVERQMAQICPHENQHADEGEARDNPLNILVNKSEEQPVVDEQGNEHRQQHHVLQERLPVGEVDSIAETAAVGNRIGEGEVKRQGRHQGNEHQCCR